MYLKENNQECVKIRVRFIVVHVRRYYNNSSLFMLNTLNDMGGKSVRF